MNSFISHMLIGIGAIIGFSIVYSLLVWCKYSNATKKYRDIVISAIDKFNS